MKNSGIAWTDSTFSAWEGCAHVSAACDSCYAETRNANANRGVAVNWGPHAPRRRTSVRNWNGPRQWNAEHDAFFAEHGRHRRVFTASLSDVFDNAVPEQWRADLLALIDETPNLIWMILTKRIGNVESMLPEGWLEKHPNVWLGATVANQADADRDIDKLVRLPAAVKFLSMEPLLGSVNLGKWLDPFSCSNCGHHGGENESGPCRCDVCDVDTNYDVAAGSDRCPACNLTDGQASYIGMTCPVCSKAEGWGRDCGFKFDAERPSLIDWIIVGGESGERARPMHPEWARSLRDQCVEAGVAFFFKQWGEWHTATLIAGRHVFRQFASFDEWARQGGMQPHHGICLDRHGERIDSETQVRAASARNRFPLTIMHRVGAKNDTRLLDDQLHDAFPVARSA